MEKPLLVKVETLARLLEVSRAKAYDLVMRGIIPSIKIDGCRRIRMDVLEAWIESNSATEAE